MFSQRICQYIKRQHIKKKQGGVGYARASMQQDTSIILKIMQL